MEHTAILRFSTDGRYQHSLDIQKAIDLAISKALDLNGVKFSEITWSARQKEIEASNSAEPKPVEGAQPCGGVAGGLGTANSAMVQLLREARGHLCKLQGHGDLTSRIDVVLAQQHQ